MLVKGIDDMLIRFGKCCQPVPGDAITGYITQGQGVTVHRTGCVNAQDESGAADRGELEQGRRRDLSGEHNRRWRTTGRAFWRISPLSSASRAPTFSARNHLRRQDKGVDLAFTIVVQDTAQLDAVLAALQRVKTVRSVRRAGA